MRIGPSTANLLGISNEPATSSATASGKALSASSETGDTFPEDTVTISSLALRALQTPDIRHNQVASLQQSVSEGRYEVDSNAIAEAMLY